MNSPSELLNPPNTVRAVLCYVRSNDEYLLLLKANGKFGEGYWNAPGGKIEPSETPAQAAVREVFEETGLVVSNIESVGFLEFYFGPGKKRPDWTAEVFTTTKFSGELKEGKEGPLRWFNESELPYDQMWEDDRHWLPLLIQGVKFRGIFEFTPDSKTLVSGKVERL